MTTPATRVPSPTAEDQRLRDDAARTANWKRWGPYLPDRQWGTVREDYSGNGNAWDYFPHDHARSRAYRWGEDGLLGVCDRQGRLCFALALWNGRDPILKERLFGLTGSQGNHGEDCKEQYFHLDSTPTHTYMKALYKYPQAEFPYARLVEENARRGRLEREFELQDAGLFDEGRYFDVQVEYAKAGPEDLLVRLTASNRGPDAARLHLLPQLWFRNTWSWGRDGEGYGSRPIIERVTSGGGTAPQVELRARHAELGEYRLVGGPGPDGAAPALLFTENETNLQRLYGVDNQLPFVKDAFHEHVVHGRSDVVNRAGYGTKAALHYVLDLPAGGSATIELRLHAAETTPALASRSSRSGAGSGAGSVNGLDAGRGAGSGPGLGADFAETFALRVREADEFYARKLPAGLSREQRAVARQAYAGLLWSKQFYHYVVGEWLQGDPAHPAPPDGRRAGRNADWSHLHNRDVISMPDKWEYPWYAAWDLAFHMLPFARIDTDFAKGQLTLFLREWYMHPNGQIPAYEWALGDVNPPVHAWSVWRVYKKSGPRGRRDRAFLASAFQKLLLNFTWWVNRKDANGRHIFAGGFLGLDNIGVFDRGAPLPTGGCLEQADGTAWMACYCLTMLSIALELASEDPSYDGIASKFFEHFVAIVDAMNELGGDGLWDEEDGFYYDRVHAPDGSHIPLRTRSLVGLIPLLAVEVLDEDVLARLPGFSRRMQWYLRNRRDIGETACFLERDGTDADAPGIGHRCKRLLAIPSRERLVAVLRYVLDENEFLSPHGIRSLSKVHERQPFVLDVNGQEHRVDYAPGESVTALFGGNSNWRGPVWMPVNFLLIEALERYHHFYGDGLKVECPTGSGNFLNLQQVATELSRRLTGLFLPDADGHRPCHDGDPRFAKDPHWKDLVLFHEYFHGDTGRGVGASHQTGWTALVATLLENVAEAAAHDAAAPGRDASASASVRDETPAFAGASEQP